LSPVFRHGSLRLYLLRLLDEEPRHGYEVIRLLRDRFMGVYSPSPGTIYPRLARLEEEGLVTHDEVDGRKVYRITDAGREELRSRSDELDELEEELSASVSDIVREVREDVRQTVRSLREELTWAARESRRVSKDAADDVRQQAARDQTGPATDEARETARRVHEQTRSLREEAASARFSAAEQDSDPAPGGSAPGGSAPGGSAPGGSAWAAWTDWPGRRGWDDRSRTRSRPGWSESLDFGTFRDLERLAVQFTSDLRKLAMQSSAVGENVITDLRAILEEALDRIKAEIFRSGHEDPGGTGDLPRHD
jgi:DNA-binding PadR family transcriptional regulator